MIADAAYFTTIIEGLHGALQDRDATGYAWSASDAWTQGRYAATASGGHAHLQAWISLGGSVEFTKPQVIYTATLTFAARYVPDDDSVSWGRAHAAALDAMEALNAYSHPSGARALPLGYATSPMADEWILVAIAFTLTIPRR